MREIMAFPSEAVANPAIPACSAVFRFILQRSADRHGKDA